MWSDHLHLSAETKTSGCTRANSHFPVSNQHWMWHLHPVDLFYDGISLYSMFSLAFFTHTSPTSTLSRFCNPDAVYQKPFKSWNGWNYNEKCGILGAQPDMTTRQLSEGRKQQILIVKGYCCLGNTGMVLSRSRLSSSVSFWASFPRQTSNSELSSHLLVKLSSVFWISWEVIVYRDPHAVLRSSN